MNKLNNEEMIKIQGGAFSYKALLGILGAGIVFFIGVVDGLINPRKCNG